MVQERGDQRRVELGDVQLAGRLAGPLGGEAEQQPERLAVGGDRVLARAALRDQPIGEIRLHHGSECAHRTPPNRASTRSAASAISSGEADKYQYVSAGLTCPREVDSVAMCSSMLTPDRCQPIRVCTAKR